MSDFGLGDDIIHELKLTKMLRWHGLLLDTPRDSGYIQMIRRVGKPMGHMVSEKIKDGMVGDSGKPLKSGGESCE